MYVRSLGQPPLTDDVLTFQVSPQLTGDWAAWFGYWRDQVPQYFGTATTDAQAKQAAANLTNAMRADLYAQAGESGAAAAAPGDVDAFVAWAMGPINSLASVALENWRGGAFQLPEYSAYENDELRAQLEGNLQAFETMACEADQLHDGKTAQMARAEAESFRSRIRELGWTVPAGVDCSTVEAGHYLPPASALPAPSSATTSRPATVDITGGGPVLFDEPTPPGVETAAMEPAGGARIEFQPSALLLAGLGVAAFLLLPRRRGRR